MDIRTDPRGRPACTSRRRMAWTAILVASAVLVVVASTGDTTARIAAVWASVVLAGAGIAAYAMSRTAFDKLITSIAQRAADRVARG